MYVAVVVRKTCKKNDLKFLCTFKARKWHFLATVRYDDFNIQVSLSLKGALVSYLLTQSFNVFLSLI